MNEQVRKYIALKIAEYAHVLGVGDDAARNDVKLGPENDGIESIRVGKRKLLIPAVAVEKKLGLNPGDLDPIIDGYKTLRREVKMEGGVTDVPG